QMKFAYGYEVLHHRGRSFHSYPNPNKVDACANIHYDYMSGKSSFKYEDVKACYQTFPFDKDNATQTIETLKGILGNFYSFFDQAREPAAKGFTFEPVDLLEELDSLLKKDYTTDFQFMSDVTDVVILLKDAHTSFRDSCYYSFNFDQQLSMYSVVRDGKQEIKIFNDTINPKNIDCQVTYINDEPAIDVITKYANYSMRTSRDLGVRFNNALASLTLEGGKIRLDSFSRQFSSRTRLPDNSNITYTLNCDGKTDTITRGWNITARNNTVFENFTDSTSYWNNICINKPLKQQSPELSFETVWSKHDYDSTLYDDYDDYEATLEEGKLIIDAQIARFYTVQDFGVAVISTETPNITNDVQTSDLFSTINQGFQSFVNMGIKKVVLDLTNNGGGSATIAHYITQLLFRDIRNFPFDQRINNASKLMIEQSTNQNSFNEFNVGIYVSPKTNASYNNITDYIGNNYYTRGGLNDRYSEKSFYYDEEPIRELLGNISNPLPWTAENLIILTNGFCGSACAHITQRLAEINVKTIAVGGFSKTPLSFACFAGGFVISSDTFFQYLNNVSLLDNSLMPKQFPFSSVINFPVNEAYSIKNPDEVLEFVFRPADYRLYYDEKSARDPSKLWVQAAALIGKKS
ncbi:4631_t:CDS:2, partial [Scutellospora calospora]